MGFLEVLVRYSNCEQMEMEKIGVRNKNASLDMISPYCATT